MHARIYIVSPLDTGEWGLFVDGDAEPIRTGAFVALWDHGSDLASGAETALLRAVNDAGITLAQEVHRSGQLEEPRKPVTIPASNWSR